MLFDISLEAGEHLIPEAFNPFMIHSLGGRESFLRVRNQKLLEEISWVCIKLSKCSMREAFVICFEVYYPVQKILVLFFGL
tara:strand:- start:240 stop:482 length:243 start_codon:yes stop_codon:yes gene_type:complete